MSSVRAFLAIPIPPQVKASIERLQKHLAAQIPDIRWTKPDNLHLTMHFFGDVSEETLEKIKVSMLSVKSCQQPFLVEVKGFGAYPSLRRPRVLWLGLQPEGQLRQLHEACRKSLAQAGVMTDSRPFSPHVTIGRLKQQKPDLTDLFQAVDNTLISQLSVDRLVLFESCLRPEGAKHSPLLMVRFDD